MHENATFYRFEQTRVVVRIPDIQAQYREGAREPRHNSVGLVACLLYIAPSWRRKSSSLELHAKPLCVDTVERNGGNLYRSGTILRYGAVVEYLGLCFPAASS